MGSLETCNHVIPMPESHNFSPGLYGYVQFSSYLFLIPHLIGACIAFNLVLVFPPPAISLFMTMTKMHKR